MGSSSQTSTQKSEPSDFIKPYLGEAMNGAQGAYRAGVPQYYQGNTVAGPSQTTQSVWDATSQMGLTNPGNRAAAMQGSNAALNQFAGGNLGDWGTVDQMRQMGAANDYQNNPAYSTIAGAQANGNANLASNLYNRIGGIAQNGGNVAGYTQGAIGDITANGAGSNSQIRSDIRDLITGQAQGLNPAMVPLMDTAGGGYLNSNPYIDDTFGRAAQNVTKAFQTATAPGIDRAFAGAGRYGSGLHANAQGAAGQELGQTLGNLATSIYGSNYANERQNQLSAANSLGNLYQSGLGLRASTAATSADQANRDAALRLQATGQISGDMSGDLARQMQAANQMTNAEQGDFANMMQSANALSGMYNTGADRQLSALNSANNAYNASRAQQLQALGLQPQVMSQLQNMDYTDLNQAAQSGAAQDAYSQNLLNADINRWDYNQNAQRNNANWYLNAINGIPGQTNSSVTQQGGNGWGTALSGLGGLGSLALGLSRMGLKF